MTYREYFNNVLSANISDEMNEVSVEFLSRLDNRNEKRKGAMTKDKVATHARRDAVLAFLKGNEGVFTRDEIATATNLTPAQVTAACKALGDAIVKSEVKIDKARKVAYSIA